jgi:tight adherence protein C
MSRNAGQTEIKKTLPDALDMLVISVEAGMGFDQALDKVAGNIKGALAEELNKMLQEMGAGLARRDALRNLARRTDVADLNAFVAAMIQGDIFGASIGRVLRVP